MFCYNLIAASSQLSPGWCGDQNELRAVTRYSDLTLRFVYALHQSHCPHQNSYFSLFKDGKHPHLLSRFGCWISEKSITHEKSLNEPDEWQTAASWTEWFFLQRCFCCSIFWKQHRRMGGRAGFFSRACSHNQQLCRISLPNNDAAIINPHPICNTQSWQEGKWFLGCFSCSLVESTKVFPVLLQGNKYVTSLPQSPEI